MSTVVDLGALEDQGFTIVGEGSYDRAGWSVSDAGDVNGDGFADFIIGAPLNGDGGTVAGKAYVIYGGLNGFGAIDLDNLDPNVGFAIQGDDRADLAGFAVSGAGDVNGDGLDDILVGANTYGFYGAFSKAYVIFGKSDPHGTIDLTDLAASDGVVFVGSYTYYGGWLSVSNAGDINGDGFDDIIIGAPYDNYEAGPFYGQSAGAAYVVFGKSEFAGVVLPGISPSDGFEIAGTPGSYDGAGWSVSGAGDVNGDGFDDVIVGAPSGNNGGNYAGEAYVVFGKASGFGTVDLSNLAADAGFVIQGDEAYNSAGFSVSAAGDVNGDGFDDVIVGAPIGNNGGFDAGEAYVIFGKASGFGTVDLSNLAADSGFIIQGAEDGDQAGRSVSAAGDVNGDGFDDLIVGAPFSGAEDEGNVYVIFGKAGGFSTIDLTNLMPADGFVLQGVAAYDYTGWSVSGAGDVDGDGFDDLLIGAPYSDVTGDQAGVVYLISGRFHFRTDVRHDFDGDGRSDILWRNDNGIVTDWLGQATGSFTGNLSNLHVNVGSAWEVAGFGDFNGDGRGDVLWRNDDGRLAEWLGQADGGFAANPKADHKVSTNWQVAGTGDFNGDGRDDILWRYADGTIIDWLGRADGNFDGNTDDTNIPVALEWHFAGTGDFNGDGRDDVLWRNDDGRLEEWLGQADGGFSANPKADHNVSTNWQIVGIGDFNGDHRDDVLWRYADGRVIEWLGRADGNFDGNTDDVDVLVGLDWEVASVGDFDGDGRDDVLWRRDDGVLGEWLGQADGGFNWNTGFNHSADNSWHVQSPELV